MPNVLSIFSGGGGIDCGFKKAGFNKFQIINSDVTDEYAEKWGYGKGMKDYIQSGLLIGRK